MSQLPTPFDPRAHQPARADGAAVNLPIGKWPMRVIGNEIKPTKNDAQQGLLELTIEVLDGPAKGVTNAKWRFNLFNNNAQAVQIAYAQLTSLCYCVGWLQPLINVDDLHGKPFIGCVTPQKNDPERTEISGCLTLDMQDPGATGAAAPAPAAAQPYAPPAAAQPAAAPAQPAWGQPAAAAPAAAAPAGPAWGGAAPAPAAAAWGGGAPAAPAGGAAPPWGQR